MPLSCCSWPCGMLMFLQPPSSPPKPRRSSSQTGDQSAALRRPSSNLFHNPFGRTTSRSSLPLDQAAGADDGSFQLKSFRTFRVRLAPTASSISTSTCRGRAMLLCRRAAILHLLGLPHAMKCRPRTPRPSRLPRPDHVCPALLVLPALSRTESALPSLGRTSGGPAPVCSPTPQTEVTMTICHCP